MPKQEANQVTNPWYISHRSLRLCMPADTSEEVADNLVATEAPAGEGEGTADAERVSFNLFPNLWKL